MDIEQRDRSGIFLKNINAFLKDDGYTLLAVKARSVDVLKGPKQVFYEVREQLEKELVIIDTRKLDPFEMDHMMFICKKK